jgi:hypothetical protein
VGNHRFCESADLSADRVFPYLAEIRNLPHYLPQTTSAKPAGEGKVRVTAQVEDGVRRSVDYLIRAIAAKTDAGDG